MNDFILNHGSGNPYVFHNLAAAISWFKVLQPIPPRSDNEPLQWIKDMISKEPSGRPAIADLFQEIKEAASGTFCGRCCKFNDSESESSTSLSESGLGEGDEDMELTVKPSRNSANPEQGHSDYSGHSGHHSPRNRLGEPLKYSQPFISSVVTIIQNLWRQPSSLDAGPGTKASSEAEKQETRTVTPQTQWTWERTSGYRPPSVFEEEEAAANAPSFIATHETSASNETFSKVIPTPMGQFAAHGEQSELPNSSIKRHQNSLPRSRSYDDLRRQTESLLKNVDKLQRSNSHDCLRDRSESLEEVDFGDIKYDLKNLTLNPQRAAKLNAMERRFIIVPPEIAERRFTIITPDVASEVVPGTPESPQKRSPRRTSILISRPNHLKAWLDKSRGGPHVSLPLTAANLEKLNKPQRQEEKEIRIVNASVYMKKVHEDAASSVPTSMLSKRTANHLKKAGLMLPFQDRSFKYLEQYTKLGKAAAVRMLLESGCNPGTRKEPRRELIFNAVRGASERHSKCVRELIKYGVDLNARNSENRRTPLHYAIEHEAWSGYSDLVYTLLAGGADPNIKDGTGDVPLLQILYVGTEPLEEHRRAALALLLAPNFNTDVNVSPPGTMNRPLHLAVRHKDPWAVGMVLEKNVPVNEKNGSGLTPLQMAMTSWSDAMSMIRWKS
jgi:hypothetical protein